jgi:hypothetical protein
MCQGQLSNIGLALRMYAQNYNGYLPPSLDAIVPYAGNAPYLYVCPSHLPEEMPESVEVLDDILGYSYFGAGLGRLRKDPDLIVLMDRYPHPADEHLGLKKGWNVLTLDLKVHFVPADSVKLKLMSERVDLSK